ncbi:hypothetical protein [Okeania sp. SIO2B3]|uniref:hypothetical protein n=1 Tax=Okeania sp. SIO2B3 TaxID=2607784 RepID=UPI0013BFD8B7|nr:hypothetical protein [Okeania sp. SIO2B3]NET43356.1 hypothetical protein [Okeania sp. SIO2B3]
MIPPYEKPERKLSQEMRYCTKHVYESKISLLNSNSTLALAEDGGGSYIATRYDQRSVNFLGGIPTGSLSHFISIAIATISIHHKIPILSTFLIDDTP